jgi:hypothetical protein
MLVMKKLFPLPIISMTGFLYCSSGDADNGNLTIHNDCNRKIRVYYDREYDSGSGDDSTVETANEVTSVSAGSDKTVEIRSDITFDGDITAVYGGIVKQFDIDFDIFDSATIHINTNDFYDDVTK